MLTVTLPDAVRQINVAVFHEGIDIVNDAPIKYEQALKGFSWTRRCTRVELIDPAIAVKTEARSICSPKDNFCKLQGRRIAANNLLSSLRKMKVYTKTDREAIFKAICPEFVGV